jgi:hypothetical protein
MIDDWDLMKSGKLDLQLIPARAQWVTVIVNRAWAMAQIIDKGGRPAMIGFRALVTGMGLAFKEATRRDAKVTWNQHREPPRYEGLFLQLVEAVLPSVEKIAVESAQSLPLKFPASPQARAKYIYEMTRKGSGKKRVRLPKTSNRKS